MEAGIVNMGMVEPSLYSIFRIPYSSFNDYWTATVDDHALTQQFNDG